MDSNTLDLIRDAIPDYARDLKLNLGSVLTSAGAPGLNDKQIWAVAVASAIASRNVAFTRDIEAAAGEHLDAAHLQAARAGVVLAERGNRGRDVFLRLGVEEFGQHVERDGLGRGKNQGFDDGFQVGHGSEIKRGGGGRLLAFVDADRPEVGLLKDAHELEADHLEQREKGDDHAAARLDVGEELLEAARLGRRESREQLIDARLDGELLGREQHARPLPGAVEHLAEGRHEREEINLDLGLRRLADDVDDAIVGPQPLGAALDLALVQEFGRGLEPLVLKQPADEGFTRILLVLLRRIRPGQQHPRLDVDQRGRHVDELGTKLNVHLHGPLHVFEILLGDGGNRDVVDVDLLLADQVEQQIERTIILFQVKIE